VYEVASPITLFFFLSLFFFYLHPSIGNRIRVLQTTLLGCKRVCHVTSASIRNPSLFLSFTSSVIISPQHPFFYLYLFFVCHFIPFTRASVFYIILCVCVRITQIVYSSKRTCQTCIIYHIKICLRMCVKYNYYRSGRRGLY